MNFKNIFLGFYTQIRSIWMIFTKLFEKNETRLYPEESLSLSPRYRGRIILTRNPNGKERCVACNLCAVVCPVSCISLQKGEKKNKRWYPIFFKINFARCIFCGLCEEACPTLAIQLIPDVELSESHREDLVYEKQDLLISGVGKYPDYDFYNISGSYSIFQKKNKNKNDINMQPINVTDLIL